MFGFVSIPMAMTSLPAALNQLFTQVYGDISGFFTLACIVAVSVCLIGMLLCKDLRKVEEFHQWRNRILISWVVFNFLGSIATYGNTLFANTKYSA